MLPRVKIYIENGALGAVAPSPDGLLGIVVSATDVPGKFELNKPYIISSYDDLATLGLDYSNNPGIMTLIREFYAEAGSGTRVYIMGVAQTVSMADMLDYTNANNARRIIEVSKGAVRGIVVKHIPAFGYVPTIEDGINVDVYNAITKGQELGDWAANEKYAPVFVIVEGRDYEGDPTLLRDLTTQTDNRVGVLIGDTEMNTNGAAMGIIAGRIAAIPVQRNIGRVSDGAVSPLTIYVDNIPAEQADVETLNEKGFISFRTFVGLAGYFFTDDNLATLPSDDYKYLTYRRTIDKAFRISYQTFLQKLLDEIPVTAAGTIQPAFAKQWEGKMETALATQMTANGELSADPSDPNDMGCKCYIDPNQVVVSTGEIKVQVRVRPFGYSRYVDVYLGFEVINS